MFVCSRCGQSFPQGGACPHDGAPLRPRPTDPMLGIQLGSFRVTRLLGQGGMGQVYLGEHPSIGSRVAIKVLSRDCAQNPELVERFFAEARTVNLIRHESIVNVLDLAILEDGRPYIVMEFLEGAPLSVVMHDTGPMPLGGLARLTLEVLAALGAAHAAGVVHRDLKPDNIFVTPAGHAKVLDFGIAKLRADGSGRSAPTQTGSVLGTPHYMAPEQALGRPVDARADLYSLGVILYEGATGRRPIDGDSLYDLLRAQVEQTPVPAESLRPDLPPPYAAVITRALAKDRDHRFGSVAEFKQALESASRGLPAHAWAPVRGPQGPGAYTGTDLTPFETPSTAPRSGPAPAVASGSPPAASGPPPAAAFGPIPATNVGQSAGPHAPGPPHPRRGRGGSAGATVVALSAVGLGVVGLVTWASWGRPGGSSELSRPAVPSVQTATAEPTSAVPSGPPRATSHADAPDPSEAKSSPAPGGGPPPRRVADATPPFDAFDVTGFIPAAVRRARTVYDDAELVMLTAQGVRPNGLADLTLNDDMTVVYLFNSPSRAQRPPDLPIGVEHKANCKLAMIISTSLGVFMGPSPAGTCEEPSLHPKCSAQQVWAKAIERGAPSGNAAAQLVLGAGPEGHRWYVQVGDAFSQWIEDAC